MKKTKYSGVMEDLKKDGSIAFTINYYEGKKKKTKMVGNSKKDKMTLTKANKIRTNFIEEAKKKSEIIKNNSIRRSEYEVGEMTLDEAFEKYYIVAKSHLTSFKPTQNQYYSKVSPALKGDKTKIKDLDSNSKFQFFNYYKDTLKPVTIEHYLSTPKALINLLKEDDLYSKHNPFKFKKKSPLKQTNYRREAVLSIQEIDKLIEEIKIFHPHRKNYKQILLFINIALSTGGRVNTILNIKTEDIEFNGNTGTVMLREPKTKINVLAHLDSNIIEELKNFKHNNQSKNTRIFTINYATLLRFLTPIFEKLFNSKLDKEDINYDYKKIVIHTFRHTFATLLIDKLNINLVHVQELLGHKDIATTAKYYTKSSKEKQKQAIIKLTNLYHNTLDDFL